MNFQLHNYQPDLGDLKTVVIEGLQHLPKQLHPKFFYDEVGSQLFDQICDQPEYYIPNVEREIFTTYADEIMACLSANISQNQQGLTLIEPGAGSTKKIRFLLDHMPENIPITCVPMDISAEHLHNSAQRLAQDYPEVSVHAICVDHTQAFQLPTEIPTHNRIFFYPGSSLGNFHPPEAIEFLHSLREKVVDDGSLLIGVDTKKSVEVLNCAYNDAAGVTAAFNLNLLQRINTELNTDIDIDRFSHHAFYNETLGRIEMHLVSDIEQSIHIMGHDFYFQVQESIHTENSYKYSVEEFKILAQQAGWKMDKFWLDHQHYFAVYFLRAC